jgi:hypothetical protein
MLCKTSTNLPWPVTTLTAVLTAMGGVVVVLLRNLPLEKLPPDAPQPFYQTIILRAAPTIALVTVAFTAFACLLERRARQLRRAE